MPSDATTPGETTAPDEEPLAAPGALDGLDEFDDTGSDEFGDLDIEEAPPPPSARRRVLGILLGLVLALVGAVSWAALTTATGRRLALLAVVFGILIGLAIRRVGKLTGIKGGIVAALLSLLGAALGQFLEGYALQANAIQEQPIVDLRHQNWTILKQWEEWGFSKGWDVFVDNLGGLSLLTLALAAAAAFIYASDSGRRKPAEEEETEDTEPGDETAEGADAFAADSATEPSDSE